MKSKILVSLVALVCIATCAFALVACNTKDDDTIDVKGNTFEFSDITVEYSSNFPASEKLTEAELDMQKQYFAKKTIVFNADGTFDWQYQKDVSGTYTQDGNNVKLVAGEEEVDAEINGSSITIFIKQEVDSEGDSIAVATINLTYTLQKAKETQVTAEQWAQILQTTNNFTIDNGDITQYVTADAYCMEYDGKKEIFVKNGDKYVCYHYASGEWKAAYMSQSDYEYYAMAAKVLTYFKDDYAQFTYANGKYTATNLDKTESMNSILTSVEITFADGNVAGISMATSYEDEVTIITVKDIGSTTIVIPTDVVIQESKNN